MALIKKITSGSQLHDEFVAYGRGESFSIEGCDALIEHYSQIENDIELDVIAIDCEWCEVDYKTLVIEYSDYSATTNDDGEVSALDNDRLEHVENDDVISEVEQSHTMIKINDDCFLIAN